MVEMVSFNYAQDKWRDGVVHKSQNRMTACAMHPNGTRLRWKLRWAGDDELISESAEFT